MLENSSNSMVNMAISLDPLSANRMMGQVDQKALQKQKEAMAPLLDKMNIGGGRLSTVESGTESGVRPTTAVTMDNYSADEFENEDEGDGN